MTKTPILTGTEVCVSDLGGQNASVQNLSGDTIWASAYPGVTAGADDVYEIPADGGVVVLDARGTVYLLGTGKVQCTGTNYATPNFRQPSSSNGGGGGTSDVTKAYVDAQDSTTLGVAKTYTDTAVNAVKADVTENADDIVDLQTDMTAAQSAIITNSTAIATVQTAAESAQSAADSAQTTADTAQTAAETAQTTADSAQAAADTNAANITATAAATLKSANTYTDTKTSALDTRVAATETAITALNGTGTGSVTKAVADGIADVVAGAPESLDTLKEISDWISSHSDSAAAMNTQIQTNSTDISALQTVKANKTDIPTTLPANGGNADTVNGHTVNADVPADAKFTDTKYTHPTTAGNKHIPAGGSSGQILKWAADGTAVWGADNNTTYSAMTGATASAAGKAGLVPAPPIGAEDYYLKGSGAWSYPMMGSYIGGTNRDLNNYASPKVLYFPYQSGDKNFPVSTSGWLMVITHGDPSWIKQIFFDLTSSNIYSRHRINGSWGAWSKYISVSPTVNPLQIVNIVQGTRNGLSGNLGTWYVPYQSGATKALVEVWETIPETSNVAKTLYGSRYLTGISSSMTETTATAVISSVERTVMVGTDTVGRITFVGSISLDTNYRVTWLV